MGKKQHFWTCRMALRNFNGSRYFYTQFGNHFLGHLTDVHFEKAKIKVLWKIEEASHVELCYLRSDLVLFSCVHHGSLIDSEFWSRRCPDGCSICCEIKPLAVFATFLVFFPQKSHFEPWKCWFYSKMGFFIYKPISA